MSRSAGLRLFREGGVYTAGLFLLRAGNFALIPLYTHLLTETEFGAVAVVMAVVNLVTIFGSTMQPMALIRLGTDLVDDRPALHRLVSTQMTWVLGATTVIALAAGLAWPWLRPYVGDQPLWTMGLAGLVAAIGTSSFQMVLAWHQFERQARVHTVLNVLRWCGLMVTVLILLGLGLRAEALLWATAASFLIGTALGWRSLPPEVRVGVLDRPMLKGALAYGAPMLPHALSGVVVLAADRLVLGMQPDGGLANTGVYELATKISSVVFMVGMGMQKAWQPFFFQEDRDHGHSGWQRVRVLSFFALAMVACGGVGIGLLAPELVAISGPPRYADAASIVPLLSGVNVLRMGYLITIVVVMSEPRTNRWIAAATLPGAVINVVLNALWIPEHGIRGAAWATAVSFGISVLLAGLLARKARKVPFKYGRAAALSLMVGGVLWLGMGEGLLLRIGLGLGFGLALLLLDGRDLLSAVRSLKRRKAPIEGPTA